MINIRKIFSKKRKLTKSSSDIVPQGNAHSLLIYNQKGYEYSTMRWYAEYEYWYETVGLHNQLITKMPNKPFGDFGKGVRWSVIEFER